MQGQVSAPRNGVVVAHGYGIKIYVERGHLVVHDGVGRQRNARRFHRVTSGLKRLVVIGHTGFVTFEALRWLYGVRGAFVQINRSGDLLAVSGGRRTDLPALRRAQAFAAYSDIGLDLTRELLKQKLAGQATLLERLPADDRTRRAMRSARQTVTSASSSEAVIAAEAAGAAAYWEAWAAVPVAFAKRDADRVPEHWLTVGARHSMLTNSPRLATSPANAIFNYLYALLEAETTLACEAVGLDAGIGLFHTDKRARDSLALDIMEPCRPVVDAYVLALLRDRTFATRDFAETTRGDCRVRPALASSLAGTVPVWRESVAPIVEHVAHDLARASDVGVVASNPAGARRRAARRGAAGPAPARAIRAAPLPSTCRACGASLDDRRRRYCDPCRRATAAKAGEGGRSVAAAVLAQLRSDGRDPAHGGEAAKARGEKNAAHQRAAKGWTGPTPDSEEFRVRILPALRNVALSAVAEATGLSEHYCSLIRLGKRVPHPRHWEAFALVAQGARASR
jgi:CRISPR-associated endonuclease Cas1